MDANHKTWKQPKGSKSTKWNTHCGKRNTCQGCNLHCAQRKNFIGK